MTDRDFSIITIEMQQKIRKVYESMNEGRAEDAMPSALVLARLSQELLSSIWSARS